MKKLFKIIILALAISGCNSLKYSRKIDEIHKEGEWYKLDYNEDGVPGISLLKCKKKLTKKIDNSIIVAVLDTQLDINHQDLSNQIWVNEDEIDSNGIDDDKNGYIDDINGWNYLTTKSNSYVVWYNFEFVRIIREFNSKFKNKKLEQINSEDVKDFQVFQKALKKHDEELKFYKNWLDALNYSVDLFPYVKDTLKFYFPKENYTYEQLDSMYNKYKINDKSFRQRRLDNDKDIGALIGFMKLRLEYDENTIEKLIDKRDQIDSIYTKSLNIDFDHKVFTGDNQYSLERTYGSGKIDLTIKGVRKYNQHSTEVSGIIGANSKTNYGVDGFSKNIKIMPLVISASGDEHDKDIALAIYYAVDNGAKVINMSFSKEFSAKNKWVHEAMTYAQEKNVLIVHCAGNDSFDIDINTKYPNDYNYDSKCEIVSNFINVGSISRKLDSTFVSSFSNYGKLNVDIFAPGEDIRTTEPNNDYIVDSGTSLAAPMVSGTAALLWLYFPNLTVQQVKQIILESGAQYNLDVLVPGGEGKKMNFSELSKSGRVLNVYNAFIMAKTITKKENEKKR